MTCVSHKKARLAIFKFASCDGCQLSLLDCEEELLSIAEIVDFAFFPEMTSQHLAPPYDIALIEGSITTTKDQELIQWIRKNTKWLVTLGACATSGGIQALRNFANIDTYKDLVYAQTEYINTLATSTPISAHVVVDYELQGCPIQKESLLRVLQSLLRDTLPSLPTHSVCTECKKNGTPCVTVAHKIACLGPVTQAGCNAICPKYGRGCYGCFGPKETSHPQALTQWWEEHLHTPKQTMRSLLHNVQCAATPFKEAFNDLE